MTIYACGCVKGAYWCSRHDIYNRQKSNDLPPHGDPRGKGKGEKISPSDDYNYVPECCSCHIMAPCPFCVDRKDGDMEGEGLDD